MCKLSTKPLLVFGVGIAVFFGLSLNNQAQRKASPSRSAGVSTASITAEKIRNDLAGRMIYDVPSEEAGEGRMNWQFSYSQLTQIHILQKVSYGNTSTVEARISAQKAGRDLDGYVDRLTGAVRLYYQLRGSAWELTDIVSISLRHGEILSGSRLSDALPVYPASTAIVPGGVTVSVAPGKYQSYPFRVADRATVSGWFRTHGGAGHDIEVFILDEAGFLNWRNYHSSPAYYNSGRRAADTIKTSLSSGNYYLVFNNTFSPADTKTVEVSADLRRDNVMYDGFERSFASDARYPAINRVSGVSMSSVAPPYVPTPNPPVRILVEQTSTARIPSPAQAPNTVVVKPASVAAVGAYSSEQILSKQFEVRKRNDQPYEVVLKRKGTLKGNFRVLDGGEKDIEVLVMTAKEYDRWSDYQTASVLYASGMANNGNITRTLDAGTYYVVFSNHLSSKAAKTIEANFYVEYMNR